MREGRNEIGFDLMGVLGRACSTENGDQEGSKVRQIKTGCWIYSLILTGVPMLVTALECKCSQASQINCMLF